jgi:hypothetical protein
VQYQWGVNMIRYYNSEDVDKLLSANGIIVQERWRDLPTYMLCNLSSKSNGELITMWHTGPGNIIPYIYGWPHNQTIFKHQTLFKDKNE